MRCEISQALLPPADGVGSGYAGGEWRGRGLGATPDGKAGTLGDSQEAHAQAIAKNRN